MKKLTILLMLSCISACKNPPTVVTECDIFKPITFSRTDTIDTKREIEAHNTKYERLCGE